MTTFHSAGDVVNGFRIVNKLGEGGYTVFYRAQKDGRDIFLKQYKEPTKAEPWFDAYVNFEQEVKHCIQTGPVKDNVYDIVDIFDWNGYIYQALEFVPDQTDLWGFIFDNKDERPGNCRTWEQRVIFAKMLMDCIKKLHASNIVHCDLKPQNVVLIKDASVKTGFLFRIADLDWSIIADKPVPWDNYMGFVGTRFFYSPEFIQGERPTFASDVFTCGVMLYLLLCNCFPFNNDKYEECALNWEIYRPQFLDYIPDVDNDLVACALAYSLHPDPRNRPTAEELHQVLLGRLGSVPRVGTAIRPESKTPVIDPSSVVSERIKDCMPERLNGIKLTGSQSSLSANIKTDIGKPALQNLCGDDGCYADTVQYTLVREAATWFVKPNPDAVNDTILNGKKIAEKTPLKPGDQLGVGREEKGIVKAVVTIQ